MKFLLPRELFFRQDHPGAGLLKLGFQCCDFCRPLSFADIFESGSRLRQSPFGFIPSGLFRDALQREKRITGLHLRATLHPKSLELPRVRRRHINVLALDVSLKAIGSGADIHPATRRAEQRSRRAKAGHS